MIIYLLRHQGFYSSFLYTGYFIRIKGTRLECLILLMPEEKLVSKKIIHLGKMVNPIIK